MRTIEHFFAYSIVSKLTPKKGLAIWNCLLCLTSLALQPTLWSMALWHLLPIIYWESTLCQIKCWDQSINHCPPEALQSGARRKMRKPATIQLSKCCDAKGVWRKGTWFKLAFEVKWAQKVNQEGSVFLLWEMKESMHGDWGDGERRKVR